MKFDVWKIELKDIWKMSEMITIEQVREFLENDKDNWESLILS